jgi:hypothetical protein
VGDIDAVTEHDRGEYRRECSAMCGTVDAEAPPRP